MTAPTTTAPEAMSLDELMDQLTEASVPLLDAGITAVLGRIDELRSKAKGPDGLTDDELTEVKQRRQQWEDLTAEKASRGDDPFDGLPDLDDAPTAGKSTQGPTVTAAAVPVPRLPLGTVTRDREPVIPRRSSVTIVAAAGSALHASGEPMSSEQLGRAIHDRVRNMGHISASAGVHQEYIPVATIQTDVDESRRLTAGDLYGNTRKIDAVTEPLALTAAGVAMPYVIDYSIDIVGVTDRPVRNTFPAFIADRGGVQFRRDIDSLGSGPASATGFWSMATDADPQGATKPVWEVVVQGPVSAEVAAVTQATKFSNLTARFDPEGVSANTRAADVAHARKAELALIGSVFAQSTLTLVAAKEVSGARDLFGSYDRAASYIRNNRRQGEQARLRTILPVWVRDAIRLDLVRALHTSNEEWLAISNAAIDTWFANRNIAVTWTLDGRAAQAAVGTSGSAGYIPAIPDQMYSPATGVKNITDAGVKFPGVVEFPLFVEGTFVFLDGGELNVGVVRDQALVQQNRYLQFAETFEGLYRKGVESVRVVQEFAPQGSSAGTISTSSLAG